MYFSATWCKRCLLYDQTIEYIHKHLFSGFFGWVKGGGSTYPSLPYASPSFTFVFSLIFSLEDIGEHDVFMTKTISTLGGNVDLDDYGIKLKVPCGALTRNERLTVQILMTDPGPASSGEEISIAPGIRCCPSGLPLNSPVTLTFNHCASLLDPEKTSKDGIVLYVRQEDGIKGNMYWVPNVSYTANSWTINFILQIKKPKRNECVVHAQNDKKLCRQIIIINYDSDQVETISNVSFYNASTPSECKIYTICPKKITIGLSEWITFKVVSSSKYNCM